MRNWRTGLVPAAIALALVAGACSTTENGASTTTGAPTDATATQASSFVLDDATRAELDAALDQVMLENPAPGVIVGVRAGDQTWIATRGVADVATGEPASADTHSRIGSVTKTMTGTLVLQLVDDGLIDLDEPIGRWFPDMPDGAAITVRMLGDMSSGIDSYSMDATLSEEYLTAPTKVWAPEELAAAGIALPRKFPPGEGFLYSNTNFVMLGLIIEDVTGKPFGEVLDERILQPLGMTSTTFPDTSELPDPWWHGTTDQGVADGAAPVDASLWSPSFAWAAGQAISTVGDQLLWGEELAAGTLLEPATQQERLEPNPASVSAARQYDFALIDQQGWLLHDGGIPGYTSQTGHNPDLDVTIVVLTNTDVATPEGSAGPVVWNALAQVIDPSLQAG